MIEPLDRRAFESVMHTIEEWAEPLSAQTAGLITRDSFKGQQLRIQLAWKVVEAVKHATSTDFV